jgi:hypothetical protein
LFNLAHDELGYRARLLGQQLERFVIELPPLFPFPEIIAMLCECVASRQECDNPGLRPPKGQIGAASLSFKKLAADLIAAKARCELMSMRRDPLKEAVEIALANMPTPASRDSISAETCSGSGASAPP